MVWLFRFVWSSGLCCLAYSYSSAGQIAPVTQTALARMDLPPEDRPTVAIAGATGFVGTAIRAALAPRFNIIGLTRSPARARANASASKTEEWRHCDLFTLHEVKNALRGADYAIYLVHSMLPSARLTQGDAGDLDVLLADNFARAAEAEGVRQIIHLGGLIPNDRALTPQLARRLEVEQSLGSGQVPLTALRAGLIVGPGGTWLSTVLKLVHRLPVMVLPKWTDSVTQPIAIDDMTRALNKCLGNPASYGEIYDLGGPDIMSYRELLKRTAAVLGKDIPMGTVPVASPSLSKLWVRAFTGAPWPLVSSLIDSLLQDATVDDNPLQRWLYPDLETFEEALQKSVNERGEPFPNPRAALRDEDDALIKEQSVARSVQRLPLPPGFTAHDVANEYMRWLPRFGWPFLKCKVLKNRVVQFYLRPLTKPLLELSYSPQRSPEGRQLFYVTGGILADLAEGHEGRLEFRRALNGRYVITAVHDFAPRLPWALYNTTQAIAHLIVMNGFGLHLRRLSARMDEQREQQSKIMPARRAGVRQQFA